MPIPRGYVIDRAIGHGASATVFRAHRRHDPALPVALKVLDDEHYQRAPLDRLQREFDTAHRLVHDHIVSMYECGSGWLAMQLVDGGTVRRLPDTAAALAAMTQIADALDYTHRLGIVHCDVKPTNILVHRDFCTRGVVLIDFGVAHVVAHDVGHRTERVESSLPYTAPELLRGHPPTAATDQYALACTTVELLIGATPFVASTAARLAQAQLYDPVPSFSRHIDALPHAFDSVITKALAKDPDNRYPTCTEFIAVVAHVLLDGS